MLLLSDAQYQQVGGGGWDESIHLTSHPPTLTAQENRVNYSSHCSQEFQSNWAGLALMFFTRLLIPQMLFWV